jgi:hypothetical protein
MKGYQKLAVFLAVLLFSVSLMSVAIDILGDISDVEFDFETNTERVAGTPSGGGEGDKSKSEGASASGIPGWGSKPLFELINPPKTRYLRWFIKQSYESGEWLPDVSEEGSLYGGEEIDRDLLGAYYAEESFFTVSPFFNLSEQLPGVLYTTRVALPQGLENLEFQEDLEIFFTEDSFNTTYGVSHLIYDPDWIVLDNLHVHRDRDYLQVPEELEDDLEAYAEQIVGDALNPYEKIKALETYLRENYQYNADYEEVNGTDPVEHFLFDSREGICTHFNSALVLMARSLGISMRVVVGFLINPDATYQIVMPRDAHLWAEAQFEGVGWVTFDATPPQLEEMPKKTITYPTVTNITYNDPTALKGDNFQVHGTVTLLNRTGVNGLTVEIFLTLRKNETGNPCGTGVVRNGFFNISCPADPNLIVGDYNLIAHTLPGGPYEESWSDPPIKIMTETEVSIQAPSSAYVGYSYPIKGIVVDKSNGKPVVNATLQLKVGNDTLKLLTDLSGSATMIYTPDSEGNRTVIAAMEPSDYHLGSNNSFGVAVTLPPTPKPNILQLITQFPFNVILFMGVAIVLLSALFISKKKEMQLAQQPSIPQEPLEDLPRTFQDPKRGVVRLFNWLFKKAQRTQEGVEESLTPREFQYLLKYKIPESGAPALEYLVTAFEIADYSRSVISKEVLNKCLAAVELLDGMMLYG